MAPASSISGSTANVAAQIQIATLAKANEVTKAQGAAVVSLLEDAVAFSKGQVPKTGVANPTSGRLDIYA